MDPVENKEEKVCIEENKDETEVNADEGLTLLKFSEMKLISDDEDDEDYVPGESEEDDYDDEDEGDYSDEESEEEEDYENKDNVL